MWKPHELDTIRWAQDDRNFWVFLLGKADGHPFVDHHLKDFMARKRSPRSIWPFWRSWKRWASDPESAVIPCISWQFLLPRNRHYMRCRVVKQPNATMKNKTPWFRSGYHGALNLCGDQKWQNIVRWCGQVGATNTRFLGVFILASLHRKRGTSTNWTWFSRRSDPFNNLQPSSTISRVDFGIGLGTIAIFCWSNLQCGPRPVMFVGLVSSHEYYSYLRIINHSEIGVMWPPTQRSKSSNPIRSHSITIQSLIFMVK